jgi:ribosomal protein S1
MKAKIPLWGLTPGLAVLVLAACAATLEAPKEAKISDEVTMQATVIDVDKETRELTLERPDGSYLEMVAGPEVRNFDQIELGNTVSASYVVSLSVRRLEPDEPDTEPSIGVLTARAKPGQAPAGAIGSDMAMTVVVKSVDQEQHVVTFTDPNGVLHEVEAERDEGKSFVKGLKPGDRVELIYEEVLAMSVE